MAKAVWKQLKHSERVRGNKSSGLTKCILDAIGSIFTHQRHVSAAIVAYICLFQNRRQACFNW